MAGPFADAKEAVGGSFFLTVARLDEAGDSSELDDYAKNVIDHAVDSIQRDIAWLDQLIAQETARNATHNQDLAVPTATENTPA